VAGPLPRQILYNLGLQQLLRGRPREAFACLREASAALGARPRLWVRLAECCVAAHHQALEVKP
jgi:CCR4-NOT transcription complex subunit 10